jgi:5-dehydro-2-deoxygluconokinase
MDAAEAWMAGRIDDQAAIADMANRFEKLTDAWQAVRERKAA